MTATRLAAMIDTKRLAARAFEIDPETRGLSSKHNVMQMKNERGVYSGHKGVSHFNRL
jgi:hypothetical protein